MIQTILTFIIVFSILVIVHEFGHYYFAKKSGILVRDFSIGFGPKIFSYRKNGTAYTLRILPIGGYVRMAGIGEEETEIKAGTPVGIVLNEAGEVVRINMNAKKQLTNAIPMEVVNVDLEKDLFIEGETATSDEAVVRYPVNREATVIEPDGVEVQIAPIDVQFQSASLPKRMITNFAGPMNNFILAIIVFAALAFVRGGAPSDASILGELSKDGVAVEAGLKEGDKIIAIDGKKVSTWKEMTDIIHTHADKEVEIEAMRDGKTFDVKVTPKATEQKDGKTIGLIGATNSVDHSFFAKIMYGFTQTWFWIQQIFVVLGGMFTKGFSLDSLSGPVGIYTATGEVAKMGILYVANFLAILSVNLGIVNLLPIPAMDGGKLVLNILEGIRRKPLDPKKEGIITIVGFAFIFILMILVTWNDIQRSFF